MVADALVSALRHHQPLVRLARPPRQVTTATSTWVWFVDLSGVNLPVPWQGPLCLRIFRASDKTVAEREDRLSTFLTAQDYPAPVTHLRGELGEPAHPFVLQSRLPGRPASELLSGPRVREVITQLGRLQGQLHRLSTFNFPLRRMTAAVYVEHDLAPRRAQTTAHDPDDWLSWLRSTASAFEAPVESDIVVCHGDFHPLNAVADFETDLRIGIVDWTDACIADRHLDVGRTVALYWFAAAAAASAFERRLLRLLRGWLIRVHVRAYQRAAQTELDRRRLLWWQILHLYRGWLQLGVLADGNQTGPRNTTTERFPPDLGDQLLARCRELRAELGG
ncbi:MAG: aminoglycoside phosphotransferase family protein [Actinobacteria bacterium]|nr:aminoglycoside phosphotransferase family protein [Actinomycetota bacterium]